MSGDEFNACGSTCLANHSASAPASTVKRIVEATRGEDALLSSTRDAAKWPTASR
jgi:hypothetical protein